MQKLNLPRGNLCFRVPLDTAREFAPFGAKLDCFHAPAEVAFIQSKHTATGDQTLSKHAQVSYRGVTKYSPLLDGNVLQCQLTRIMWICKKCSFREQCG